MPSILVTGGAGYIGSHVVLELLGSGYAPVVIDDLSTGVRSAVPQGIPFHRGRVDDVALLQEIFRAYPISAVMHFSGSIIVPESVEQPAKYYRNNTLNSLVLAEESLRAGVRHFIFSSTAAVYGIPKHVPVNEDHPTDPISPYGLSKLMTEQMLRDIAVANETFRPVCLRYFNVAGADPLGRAGQQGPQSTHLIRTAIETALGRNPVLHVFGSDYDTRDGTCERDYIHVSDLAAAHVAALRYLEGGGAGANLNCGYGVGHTVLEIVAALEALTGRKLPLQMAPRRAGDPPSVISDTGRIQALLDWRPAHAGLAEIIGSALAWQEKLAK